jgi:hypothetical protein
MPARLNLVDRRFGRLLVLADAGNRKGRSRWLCRCDCGKKHTVDGKLLTRGHTNSCGCLHGETVANRNRIRVGIPSKRRLDLTGKKFGRLLVIGLSRVAKNSTYWRCRCDCGEDFVTKGYPMSRGKTVSCGCAKRERLGKLNKTHGLSHTREFRIWAGMLTRCTNPNASHYENYGGRGITVCDRWLESFESFLSDMGMAPSTSHSVERRDNEKGYEPGNCCWVHQSEQARNRRSNVMIEINGETRCAAEWERILGLPDGAIGKRRRRDRYREAPEKERDAIAAFELHVRTVDHIRCYWCGRRVRRGKRHVDHIVPITKGGAHALLNLCCACEACNRAKSSKLPEVFSGQFELFAG